MEQLTAIISGIAIALVVYDVIARLQSRKEMATTLALLNKTHNDLMQSFQGVSEQVSRLEMTVGIKSKPVSNRI